MSTGALRAALKRMANAADAVGVAHFDSDDLSPEVEELQRSTEEARAALAQPVSAVCVPLTDEQIDAVPLIGVALPERFHETRALNAALRQFARAIEHAHGIGEPK